MCSRRLSTRRPVFFSEVAAVDAQALAKLEAGQSKAALEHVEAFSLRTANGAVDAWVELWQHLFVRYRDGLRTEVGPEPLPGDEPRTDDQHLPWSDAWKERFVQATGERFVVPRAGPTAPVAVALYEERKLAHLARGRPARAPPVHSQLVSLPSFDGSGMARTLVTFVTGLVAGAVAGPLALRRLQQGDASGSMPLLG